MKRRSGGTRSQQGRGSKSGGGRVRCAGIVVSRTRRAMAVSRMHADEVDTDVALVRRLVAGQFPQWGDRTVEPVRSAGTVHALYRLGTDMVVRLPRVERATSSLEKELQGLPRLGPRLPLAVPMPLASGV